MSHDSPWLVDLAGGLLNLTTDRLLLDALGRLATPAPDGATVHDNSVLDALLTRGLGSDSRLGALAGDLLAQAGVPTAEINVQLQRILGLFASPGLENARLLLCRPMDLGRGACANLPKTLTWTPLERTGSNTGVAAGSLSFKLDGAAGATLVFDAAPELPDGCSLPAGMAALAVTVEGRIQAAAGIGFPIHLGRAQVETGTRGAVTLRYWLAVPAVAPIATGAAIALGALVDPFDLAAVAAEMGAGTLVAIGIVADGEVSLAGQLAVGIAGEVVHSVDANLGIQAGFTTRREGRFHLRLQRGTTPGTVLLDLQRERSGSTGQNIKAGLTLEMTGLLQGLKPELLKHAGTAKGLLEKLDDLLPPSRFVEQQIRTHLNDAGLTATDPGTDTAAALVRLLGGGDPSRPDLVLLTARIAAAIDEQPRLWQDHPARVAELVLGRVLVSVTLGESAGGASEADIRTLLTPLLSPIIEKAIGTLREGLQRRVDSKLTRATRQLARFQANLAQLTTALQRSAEIKLEAAWRWEETNSQGTQLGQRLLFRPGTHGGVDVGEIYRRVLTGSLEQAFEAAGAGTDGEQAVEVLSGSLGRIAGIDRSAGFNLTLLDFALETTDLLDADVQVTTDVAGNIQVLARAESLFRTAIFGEATTFRSVNVYELATARASRHMTLAMSLSHDDDDLRRGEVAGFFSGLVDARIGLLPEETRASALSALDAFRAAGSGGKVAGELRIWLDLDDTAVRRLLQLPAGALARAPRLDRAGVYRTAIDAMLAGLAVTGSDAVNNNLEHFIATRANTRDLREVLIDLDDDAHRRTLGPHPTDAGGLVGDAAQFDVLIRISDRARGLVDALQQMREIYLGEPTWGPERYRDAQVAIDRRFKAWAKGEPADRGILSMFRDDTVRPYSLAFFKAIADLVRLGPGGGGQGMLLASLVLRDAEADGGREHEVQLVAPRPLAFASTAAPSAASAPELVRPPPTAPAPGSQVPAPLASRAAGPTDQSSEHPPRDPTMSEYIFPLLRRPTLDFESGARNFGARRNKGKRKHAGCDLKMPPDTPILAMADGEVTLGPYNFYSGTCALEVKHEDGKVVRYGEIRKRVPDGIYPGAKVKRGQVIAFVGKLNSGDSMLHLEMYEGTRGGPLTQAGTPYVRRADLMNPTRLLKEAKLLSELRDAAPDSQPPKTFAGRVGTRVVGKLNVRERPDLGAKALARLDPGAKIDVRKRATGAAHPFGDRTTWLEVAVSLTGQASKAIGYVVAYFIDVDGDLEEVPKYELSERAVVSAARLTGPLKVRTAPRLDAEVLDERLQPGQVIEVVDADVEGDVYKWDRKDWVKLRLGSREAFAAGYFIDLIVPDGAKVGEISRVTSGAQPEDEWVKAMLDAPTTGASAATSRYLGGLVGIEASQALAREDLKDVVEHADRFASAAGKSSMPAALLAAVASRESRVGKALENGWGDKGNAFGIMQVDKRYHEIGDADPFSISHIEQAATILNGNLLILKRKLPNWEKEYLLKGAVAAYNFGTDDVRTKSGIDKGTAHDDYSSDVLARARFYYNHPDLEIFRA